MSKDSDFVINLRSEYDELTAQRASLISEITAKNERLQTINGAIAGIEYLLKLKKVGPEPLPNVAEDPSEVQLPEILKNIMSDRKQYTVDLLQHLVKAKGFDFGEKNPQRTIGFTLLGLQRGGKFEKDNYGRWRYNG